MKKLLVAFILVLAIALGSFLWVRSQMGQSDPASLVPQDTIALVALPDLPRSVFRWPTTALGCVGAEPEMKAFLEKPLAAARDNRSGEEARRLLEALKPGRVFAAAVPDGNAGFRMLVGVQFWGGREDFETAVARLRSVMARGEAGEVTREPHAGTEISRGPVGKGEMLCWAAKGRWGFLSTEREAVAGALDLLMGGGETLASAEDYARVQQRLPSEPDFIAFARPGPALDLVLQAGAQFGFTPDETQADQLRKAQAAGFGLKMDGADLREAAFVLRPDPPEMGALRHVGMPLTNAQTLAYFDFLLRPKELAALVRRTPAAAALESDGTDLLQAVPTALGGEGAVLASWPADAIRPRALLTLGVKDRAATDALLLRAATLLPEVEITEENGIKFFGFPSLRSPFLDPAVALSDSLLVAAADTEDIRATLAAAGTTATLEAAPSFATAIGEFRSANEGFGFLDTRGIFERAYPMLRQVIIFGAAFAPGMAEVVDASKLPQTETISKHLNPIVFSQTRLPEGYLLESRGPLTMLQVALLAGGGGSAFLGPRGLNR